MIQSGITATKQMCLTTSGGQLSRSVQRLFRGNPSRVFAGTAVVLEECMDALAAGDGRELWKLQPNGQLVSLGGKCAGLLDNDAQGGGQIVLMDCDSALKNNDGRSQWAMLGNGQMKLARHGDYCLSQNGPGTGRRNVATKAAATATSSFNVEHGDASRRLTIYTSRLHAFFLQEPQWP